MRLRRILAVLLAVAALAAPAGVALGVWWPVFQAFAVADPSIPEETVTASVAFPAAETVADVSHLTLGEPGGSLQGEALESAAERLLAGTLDIPGYPRRPLAVPFDADAAFEGKSNWQLAYASFLVPKLYLAAFKQTGRDEFLAAALQFILGWSDFAAEVWAPESFVWNDHAVAARSGVLADFWAVYKDHPSFSREAGKRILQLAARLAAFLERDINYTFRTNHGTMQSLAILKMAAYFPEISAIQHAKQVAADRLTEQFTYFINDEGAVLEHSAEYHRFGIGLLEAAMRLMSLNGFAVPEAWTAKREAGERLLQALTRPDGSLPRVGDSNTDFDRGGFPGRDKDDLSLFLPQAGYAVWWSGEGGRSPQNEASQTVVKWSYFPFMGHKHADELSFTLWKAGQDWWTAVGYWPYTDVRREAAISWPGSNAPHLTGESAGSARSSKVTSYVALPEAKVIDLERLGPDGFKARRQIINLGTSIWLVLDSFTDPERRRASVSWIVDPGLTVRPGSAPDSFVVDGPQTPLQMAVSYRGSAGFTLRQVHGASDPLTGWVASRQTITPASALVVEQSAQEGWVAALSVLGTPGSAGTVAPDAFDVAWKGPESWSASLSRDGATTQIRRTGSKMTVAETAGGSERSNEIALVPVTAAAVDRSAVVDAFDVARGRHGDRFLPLIAYREKVTLGLAIAFALNALGLFVLRRWLAPVSVVSLTASVMVYVWLMQVYFVS